MSYNGHKNYNHWNVSLWLDNDEGLYLLVKDVVDYSDTLDEAAEELVRVLPKETPDGVKYSFSSVRAHLVGWEV